MNKEISRKRRIASWMNRRWSVGKENYVRFWPNPGFRIVFGKKELRWNKFYGWRHGKVV